MPPKKKKVVANGFTMYMLEMQREILEQQGRRVPIPQLVDVANPRWKTLSPSEKAFYNEEAKRYKQEQKNAPNQTQKGPAKPVDNRRDITGNLVSNRHVVKDRIMERRKAERQLLIQSWSSGQDVRKTKFYFIAFQTLCVLPNKQGYLPCELACIEYTLAHGIKKTFHRFLKPGPIPLGYRYTCQSNSDSTHQIPVEGHESATGNYQKVWQDLVAFVNPENQRVTPAIFCESRMRDMVDWSLAWLASKANISNSLRKVMDVELLMTELYGHAEQVAHSWTTFCSMLEDSKWDHMRDTRCDYHEDLDVAIHKCALGVTKKYCYHLSDPIACDIYGVTLTNKHLPESTELDGMASIVYPKPVPQQSYPQSVPQTRPQPQEHQPPVARIYRGQQRSQEVDDQPIRRPTTDFATSQSQQNKYYASTDPEAPSPSAVPMPNFQWQSQANSDPYESSNRVDDLSQHFQSTSIGAGMDSQPFPGIGRGLGRGMPGSTLQTPAAMGLGRGIGRGIGRGVPT